MRTEKQREASRRNGAKSRGPVSAAGKARSSQNGLKHGLRAQSAFALPPSPEEQADLEVHARMTLARRPIPIHPTPEILAALTACLWQKRVARNLVVQNALNSTSLRSLEEAFANDAERQRLYRYETTVRFARRRLIQQLDDLAAAGRLNEFAATLTKTDTTEPEQPGEHIPAATENRPAEPNQPDIFPEPNAARAICANIESNTTEPEHGHEQRPPQHTFRSYSIIGRDFPEGNLRE